MILLNQNWEPHFIPKSFAKANPDLTLEDRRLNSESLENYALVVSKIRKELREYALEFDQAVADELDIDVNQISSLPTKI